MENAIHKKTGKHVSAYQISTGLEWKGKEKDEFIAPYHGVGNWIELKEKGIEEVKVSFIKVHKREYQSGIKTIVDSHFRIITEGAIENPENESEEHLLAKENIYSKAINDEIILKIPSIGSRKLSSFGEIKDIRIEKGAGKKRADVLVKFKNHDSVYGKGIAFEVQISPQNKKETIKRNYDRASYGYSVVWIWSDDLQKESNEYNLIPYHEALETYKKQISNNVNQELWDISRRSDEKVEEIRDSLNKEINELRLKRSQLKEDINSSIEILKKIQEQVQEENKETIEKKLKEVLNKFNFNQNSEKYFIDNLPEKLYDYLNEKDHLINQSLNLKINEIIEKNIKKEIINDKINEGVQKYLKNYDSEIKKDIFQKNEDFLNQSHKKSNEALDSIRRDCKLKIQTDLKREYEEQILKLVKEVVKKNIHLLLNGELSKLKEDSIDNFAKNKVSSYLRCPKCKKDKSIMLFKINKDGIINCLECLKGDDGKKES